MLKKNLWKTLAISAAMTTALSGCAAQEAISGGEGTAKTELAETKEAVVQTSESVVLAENLSTVSTDDLTGGELFTERDLDGSYDASEATAISLKGSSASVSGNGAEADGSTVTITKKGVYVISGTLKDGQIIVDAADEKVQIVLAGADITNDDGACIYVKSADKVFLTLADGTENVLSDAGADYVQTDESVTVDGVIYARDDITINGGGALTVNAGYKHGIVSKDDLKITGGTIVVHAADKGLAGKDSVRIAGGDITVVAADDAIHSSNSEEDGKGYVAILDGTLVLTAGDDGIHAEQALLIAGGSVDVTDSYEGLEGKTIDITGGDISIYARDDGVNAAFDEESGVTAPGGHGQDFGFGGGMGMDAQADAYLNISGGSLYVNAGGDGLDSNGYLYVDGGTVVVDGPTNDGNGALDCGIAAKITGGTVIAAGSSGMAETFGNDSTQYSILVNFDSTIAGETTVTLADESGKEVLSATPAKNYRSVVFSSPKITKGTYTVYAGSETVEIEVSDVATRVGGSGGFGGQKGFGSRGGFGPDGSGNPDGQMPDGGQKGFGGQNGFGEQNNFGGRGGRQDGGPNMQRQQKGSANT